MYGVYICQLLRFAHAHDRYLDYLARHKRLVRIYLTRVFDMASSAENPNSFTGPTIPWSSVIPTQWRSISGRVSIVRFSDGASAFCWLAQQWLAPTDYQFTLSLLSSWFFPPFLFLHIFVNFCIFLFFYFDFFIFFIYLLIFFKFYFLFFYFLINFF